MLRNFFVAFRFVCLLLFSGELLPATFTYSGPTEVIVPYTSLMATGTYNFSYSGLDKLYFPKVVIMLDGTILNTGRCSPPNTFVPASYNITFSPGVHTVKFGFSGLDGNCNNLTNPIEYSFTVTCYYKVQIQNSFQGGLLYVNNYTTPENSPTQIGYVGDLSLPIGAIDQTIGESDWVWNSTGNNQSLWNKKNVQTTVFVPISSSRNYTAQLTNSDVSALIQAEMKKNCRISLVKTQPEINVTQNADAQSPIVVGNTGSLSAPASITDANNTVYKFSRWSDYFANENPRTISPTNNTTYTAIYKALSATNSSSNFARPGAQNCQIRSDHFLPEWYSAQCV